MYTYIPISPPSCVSLPPSLSHPSRWTQSTELISLGYAAASHRPSVSHLVVYIENNVYKQAPLLSGSPGAGKSGRGSSDPSVWGGCSRQQGDLLSRDLLSSRGPAFPSLCAQQSGHGFSGPAVRAGQVQPWVSTASFAPGGLP